MIKEPIQLVIMTDILDILRRLVPTCNKVNHEFHKYSYYVSSRSYLDSRYSYDDIKSFIDTGDNSGVL